MNKDLYHVVTYETAAGKAWLKLDAEGGVSLSLG
jgi:hypothetical protein